MSAFILFLQRCWEVVRKGFFAAFTVMGTFLSRGFRYFTDVREQHPQTQTGLRYTMSVVWAGLKQPLYLPISFLHSCRSFFTSRPILGLLQGIPIIVVVLILAIAQSYSFEGSARHEVVKTYLDEYEAAFAAEDYERASLCLKALTEIEPEVPRYGYARALVAEKLNDLDTASAIMQDLAAREDYDQAHLWIGRQWYNRLVDENGIREKDPDGARTMVEHLLAIRSTSEHYGQANDLLANYYIASGDRESAMRHWGKASDQLPQTAIRAAVLARQLKAPNARDLALQALRYHMARHESRGFDQSNTQALVQCYLLLGQEEQAIRLLVQAGRAVDDPRIADAISNAYLTWADRIGRGEALANDQIAEQFAKLELALKFNPSNTMALRRLGDFAISNTQYGEPTVKRLRELLAQGDAPEKTVRFVLGTYHLFRGELGEAKLHLEQAIRDNPNLPNALNNLAVVMSIEAGTDEVRLGKCLQLVDTALEKGPDNVYFHETKGQILIKLNKFPQAISHLTKSLNKRATPPLDDKARAQAHAGLAFCYREMGDEGMARVHADEAEKTK